MKSVAQYLTAPEQPVIGEVDPVTQRWVDHRAKRRDVVLKRVLGFDQDHIGRIVECLGEGDAAVSPADDHDARVAAVWSRLLGRHLSVL